MRVLRVRHRHRSQTEGGCYNDLVAWTFSRSDAAPHLFGDDLARFEAELRAMLAAHSDSGAFSEPHPGTEILVWFRP